MEGTTPGTEDTEIFWRVSGGRVDEAIAVWFDVRGDVLFFAFLAAIFLQLIDDSSSPQY